MRVGSARTALGQRSTSALAPRGADERRAPVVAERMVQLAEQIGERTRDGRVLCLGSMERVLEPALFRLLRAQLRVNVRGLQLPVACELDA